MKDLFEKIYEYNRIFNQGMLFVVLKAVFTKWWLVLNLKNSTETSFKEALTAWHT